jgi:hypothetical protein
MNLEKDKISRPNKTFIEQKDCLDKELKDKTPMRPQLPKKKPLLGEYEKKEFFTSGRFQNYTDYAKYFFSSANVVENKYLNKIQETDCAIINTHLDDFERWIETIKDNEPSSEVVVNYDFDREIIDTEDYFYIDSEEHTWSDGHTSLVRYNIYLFDSQTQVLYYFHNNI